MLVLYLLDISLHPGSNTSLVKYPTTVKRKKQKQKATNKVGLLENSFVNPLLSSPFKRRPVYMRLTGRAHLIQTFPNKASFLQGKKVMTPPSPLGLFLNDILYWSITTVTPHVDWPSMVYSCALSSDLFLIFGFMTSNFMCLSFFTLRSSSLWING